MPMLPCLYPPGLILMHRCVLNADEDQGFPCTHSSVQSVSLIPTCLLAKTEHKKTYNKAKKFYFIYYIFTPPYRSWKGRLKVAYKNNFKTYRRAEKGASNTWWWGRHQQMSHSYQVPPMLMLPLAESTFGGWFWDFPCTSTANFSLSFCTKVLQKGREKKGGIGYHGSVHLSGHLND